MAPPPRSIESFVFGLGSSTTSALQDNGNVEDRQQRFREAPGKLRAALANLRAAEPTPVGVLHLGDIVNGSGLGEDQTLREFKLIAGIFDTELVSVNLHALCSLDS